MYQVDISYFNERENDREWGESECIVNGMSYEEADDFAWSYASMTLNLTDSVKLKGCDGCSIDVRKMADPEPHAYISGYEFCPGHTVNAWACDDVPSCPVGLHLADNVSN